MENEQKNKGITLVALVITIIILILLAGITISSLTKSELIKKTKEAKQVQTETEIKEHLELAINSLQIEKEGLATIKDITQEWADSELNEYSPKN